MIPAGFGPGFTRARTYDSEGDGAGDALAQRLAERTGPPVALSGLQADSVRAALEAAAKALLEHQPKEWAKRQRANAALTLVTAAIEHLKPQSGQPQSGPHGGAAGPPGA